MKHMMKQLIWKLPTTGLMFVCLVFAHSIGAQQQSEHNQETRELLDELALKIQVTVAAIEKNEALAGNEKTLNYSIDIPVINKLELGLELDLSDPSNGFRVQSVDENSLANQLGIKTGDLVVTVNHFEVNQANTEVILSELQSLQAGDTLALMISRDNRLKQITLMVEESLLPPATIYVGKEKNKNTSTSSVPEPFQGFDDTADLTINYDVLTVWLDALVVDVGRSDRRSASVGRVQVKAPLGTRIKPKVTDRSLFEGNRFFFESLRNNEEARQLLKDMRNSLEQIPAVISLASYSRDEQLAYWLNLYNVTILNEVVGIYPTRSLEEFLVGEDSILSEKLLTVAGIPLSLNDIQFTILKENYDNNPLVIYGLYQGIIGGPNIRKEAYNGATVYRALESNAKEFINSNRGTNLQSNRHKVRKVSSLYARNKPYFPDFNKDLSKHLSKYIDRNGSGLASFNTTLDPVIDDWTVNDLWGTFPEVHFSGTGSAAALMGTAATDFASFGSPVILARAAGGMSVFRPDLYGYLLLINSKRENTNKKNATVEMEELGEVPVEPEAGQ